MSKQSDLVNVAQDAGASGYVNTTGDTMTGALNITASGSGSAGSLNINATDPFIRFYDSNGATDARKWDIRAVGNSEGLVVRTVNDANTSFATRLAVDPSGRVTMPYQPAFYVRFTSGSHSSGTVPYNEVQVNIGSHYSTSTGRFTAPVAGKYIFFTQAASDRTTNTGDFGVDIRKNGSIIIRTYFGKNSNNVHAQCSGSCVIDLAANDWVDVSQYGNVGVNLAQNGNHNNFGGHLIG